MIRGRNIVCVASSWFDHPTSKHHVMRLLAEENHVIWVNYHASRRPALGNGDARLVWQRLQRVWAGPQRVAPQLDVISPLLVPWPESPTARWLNGHLLARCVRQALARLPRQPVQLWLFTPDAPELIDHLALEKVVYYCVDEFAAFSGYNADLVADLERRTLAGSHVVIATSAPLQERLAQQHANVHFVPHGVDLEHFAAATSWDGPLPADIRNISRPIFGYMGLISDWVDLDLLATTARARPDWSFVLLGAARCSLAVLHGLRNVHCLGSKPYGDLPGYCAAFDVGLIPFRATRLVHAVNPIKLREYLAAGLPVVSTPMPEVMRHAPAVQVATTGVEFLPACERALALARSQPAVARQALVASEGWRARLATLAEHVTGQRQLGGSVGHDAVSEPPKPRTIPAERRACAARRDGPAYVGIESPSRSQPPQLPR